MTCSDCEDYARTIQRLEDLGKFHSAEQIEVNWTEHRVKEHEKA